MILFLEKRKDRPAAEVTCLAWDVEQWALEPRLGGLPERDAHTFAGWLEDVWSSYAEDTGLTVGQALAFALKQWKEGRS